MTIATTCVSQSGRCNNTSCITM